MGLGKESYLTEKKNEIRKEWEDCFEVNMEDAINTEGIKFFYDENTSIDEATDMLTAIAIELTFGRIIDELGDIDGIAIISRKKDKPKSKETEGSECKKGKFAVLEKSDGHVYADRFKTDEEANDFIKTICMNTTHTFDDFKVIQEL